MSLPNEDLFIEKFALYLAVGLLGPKKVVEYLNDLERKEQPAVPLYWRSNPMIPGASRMLYHTTGTRDSTSAADPLSKILFFDTTFTFVNSIDEAGAKDSKVSKQKPSRSTRILVSLGFFLLLRKGPEADSGDERANEFRSGHYVSSQPLDFEQILSYMNSLQLDRDSVSPEKLAESTAEEFLRQGSSSDTTEAKAITSCPKIDQELNDSKYVLTVDYVSDDMSRKGDIKQQENNDVKSATSSDLNQGLYDSSSICVNVPCKSMGDTNGKLILKYLLSGVAKFDAPALRFLSWDFSKSPPNRFGGASKNAETLLSNRDLVGEAFARWQIQTKISANTNDSDKNSGNQNSIRPTGSTTNGNGSGSVTNEKAKKRKRSKGMAILPSARRKRNKGLVYDSK